MFGAVSVARDNHAVQATHPSVETAAREPQSKVDAGEFEEKMGQFFQGFQEMGGRKGPSEVGETKPNANSGFESMPTFPSRP
jgi:hypothetical protein